MKLEAESFVGRLLVSFGFHLLKWWAGTIRFAVEDRGRILELSLSQRVIGAAWHSRLLFLPFALTRFLPQRHGAALISASRDGAWFARLVDRFGFDVVRGSSSRKGAAAILQLAAVITSGADAVITPDGPRGPAYRPGGGLILLAQKTGAQVVPLNLEYSSCWRLRSWDRFILPRPFCKARFILGAPLEILPTNNEQEFERERARIESAMMSLVETR